MKESLSKLSERSLKITYKRKINDTKVLLFATTINLKTKILFIFICNVFYRGFSNRSYCSYCRVLTVLEGNLFIASKENHQIFS